MSIALCPNKFRCHYPQDLIEKVQMVLPHNEALIGLMRIGSVFVVEQTIKEEAPQLFNEFKRIWEIQKKEAGFMLVN